MKTFFYIFKRILIGTCIALLVGFIRGKLLLNTYALQVSPYNLGQSPTFVISNQDTSVSFGVTGSPYSVHAGTSGYINFNFSVYKVGGSSTSALVMPRGASVSFGTGNVSTNFICDIGSVSSNNSTFNSQVYTAHCPVTANSNGLTQIYIAFQDFQANDNSTYRVIINSGISYEIVDNVSVNVDTSGTTSAINNQITNDNTNTQNIINNQDSNTQDIIDNQNTNTQDLQDTINDNFQNCTEATTVNPTFAGVRLSTGNGLPNRYLLDNNNSGAVLNVSKYVDQTITINFTGLDTSHSARNNYCFAGTPALSTYQQCLSSRISGTTSASNSFTVTVPTGANYLYMVGYNSYIDNNWVNNVTISLPKVCFNRLDEQTQATKDINNTLTDDDITGANGEASDFFNNFQHDSHGLSGIITAPLRLINALTTAQCTPLQFQLPFIHNQVTLPCMRGIYENYFGVFFSLYQLITTGLVCYNVMINLYSKIHNLQNPKNDRIEVLNL